MHRYYSLSAPGTFALYHDNEGDYIPSAAGGSSGCYSGSSATQCGLHNAYESGDIGLLNAQGSGSGTAQAGASRLAGFTCGPPPSSPFCLVSDDATGGNNAWAMLALLDEYGQTGNTTYLNDAITIGNWIVANLEDNSGTGYGGYYAGYFGFDSNMHGVINFGKSTENNADIFAAFTALASAESKLGNQSAATSWTNLANVAGDFVMQMFDSSKGRFNAGTVPAGTPPSPGICPTGAQKGNDVVNVCDFVDSNTFTSLAMAGAPRYQGQINWRQPIQYVLSTFAQTVTAAGMTFQGFDIVPTPVSGANGISVGIHRAGRRDHDLCRPGLWKDNLRIADRRLFSPDSAGANERHLRRRTWIGGRNPSGRRHTAAGRTVSQHPISMHS